LVSAQAQKFPRVDEAFRAAWSDPYDQAVYDVGLELYCSRFRDAAGSFDRCQ